MALKWTPMCALPGRPRGYSGKESLANAGDTREAGLHPGLGRFLEGGHGYPLQDSCLENSKDRAAWWAVVHGVTQSQTWLNPQAHALSTLKAELYRHLECAPESPEFHLKCRYGIGGFGEEPEVLCFSPAPR